MPRQRTPDMTAPGLAPGAHRMLELPAAGRGPQESAMTIQSLGYVGIRTKSLEDWTTYGSQFLGMQVVDQSRSTLALRMDDRKQRVVITEDGGEGPAFCGWEAADAAAQDAVEAAAGGRPAAPGGRCRASPARSPTSSASRT